MYTKYFGLTGRPFDNLPGSRFISLSRQHSRAIANIKFAVMNRDSFVIITGEIGIGKSTILKKVYSELGNSLVLARLAHTTLSPVELLQAILLAFKQPVKTNEKVFLLDKIYTFLLDQNRRGKHVVIAVDEAQNLSADALEELRLLTSVDADERRLLTVVLIGQQSLNELVDSNRMTNLRQRTRLRQHLECLSASESLDYLRNRLAAVGGDFDRIFEPDTASIIHQVTGGVPRLINTLCDTALTGCAVSETPSVDCQMLEHVLDELDWEFPRPTGMQDLTSDKYRPPEHYELMICSGEQSQYAVTIDTLPFLIGRDISNHLCIRDNTISGRHAVIYKFLGRFAIEDMQSTTGISVNGRFGCNQIISPGDIITIGATKLMLYSATESEESAGRSRLRDRPQIIFAPQDEDKTTAIPSLDEDDEEMKKLS